MTFQVSPSANVVKDDLSNATVVKVGGGLESRVYNRGYEGVQELGGGGKIG